MMTSAMTLTFGECAENHVGNQQLGSIGSSGFSVEELRKALQNFETVGCAAELLDLGRGAAVLVVRGGLKAFGVDARELYAEHDSLDPDKKCMMYNRVVNKRVSDVLVTETDDD